MAKTYELVLIFDPGLDDEALEREIDKVKQFISTNEGRVIEENRWGLRRLAYEIRNKQQGNYTLLLFEGEQDLPANVEQQLKLNEHCLRYLTVVAQEREKPAEEVT